MKVLRETFTLDDDICDPCQGWLDSEEETVAQVTIDEPFPWIDGDSDWVLREGTRVLQWTTGSPRTTKNGTPT